jgi:hypothetical protein
MPRKLKRLAMMLDLVFCAKTSIETGFFARGDAKNMILFKSNNKEQVLVVNNDDLLESFSILEK